MKYIFNELENWSEILKRYKPIIADTNFFLACLENQVYIPDSIDVIIDQAYKLIVTKSIIKEIENLKDRSKLAHKSLKLIEMYAMVLDEKKIDSGFSRFVDDQIIELAIKLIDYNPIIASGDKGVQKKALMNNIPVLTFRNKNLRVINGKS
ncbi:MAG: hypothetical protein ACW967_06440 [Candidatus Hodarchaeales archaeon]